MTAKIQTPLLLALLGPALLIMLNGSTFVPLQPAAATANQTSNQTEANMTTTTTGGGTEDQATAKTHLGEAMKALQAGDTAGAEMHTQVAQDYL